jgi:hypothetical protein
MAFHWGRVDRWALSRGSLLLLSYVNQHHLLSWRGGLPCKVLGKMPAQTPWTLASARLLTCCRSCKQTFSLLFRPYLQGIHTLLTVIFMAHMVPSPLRQTTWLYISQLALAHLRLKSRSHDFVNLIQKGYLQSSIVTFVLLIVLQRRSHSSAVTQAAIAIVYCLSVRLCTFTYPMIGSIEPGRLFGYHELCI